MNLWSLMFNDIEYALEQGIIGTVSQVIHKALENILAVPMCFIFKNARVWPEGVVWRCSVKKMFLEISQNLQKNTCARVSFLIKLQACNFNKKETLTQVYSCEFCEIYKNTFFTEHLWWLVLYDILVNELDKYEVHKMSIKVRKFPEYI